MIALSTRYQLAVAKSVRLAREPVLEHILNLKIMGTDEYAQVFVQGTIFFPSKGSDLVTFAEF